MKVPVMARDRLIEASCLVKPAFLVCAPHRVEIETAVGPGFVVMVDVVGE